MPAMYNKCPKCLTVLGWKTEICPECQYDVKNKIEAQPTSDFNEQVFPWLLLGTGILFNLLIATLRAGPGLGLVAVIIAYTILMVVQVPLVILGLLFTGRIFGIDYGYIFTGVLKLAGLCMFTSGLASMAQLASLNGVGLVISITFLMLPVVVFYLFSVLFNLSFWETIVSLVSLSIFTMALQFGALLLTEEFSEPGYRKPSSIRRAVKVKVTKTLDRPANR